MYNVWGRAFIVTIFVVVLGLVWGWGAPPPNNDVSNFGNTAGGTGALVNNNAGTLNTAFGARALQNNTNGLRNTAFGFETLSSNNTGTNNTASGVGALRSNSIGNGNTASGAGALQDNTEGADNTASGVGALLSNIDGTLNTAFGTRALWTKTTGNQNTAIGENAGWKLSKGDHNIYLGHEGEPTESNTMRLGQKGRQTRTFIAGIDTIAMPGGSQVMIDSSSGLMGILTSSARYKRDIDDMGERSRGVFKLRPVTFRYTQDPQGVLQYGLIAEEVAAVYPELVVRGPEGTVESVQYHELIPLLLNEMQHQQQELGAQSQKLAELKTENERLQLALVQQNAELAARLARLEEATAPTTTSAGR